MVYNHTMGDDKVIENEGNQNRVHCTLFFDGSERSLPVPFDQLPSCLQLHELEWIL